ncbi:MAG: dipeptidase [Gemmatimonadetes bacterium]|nr:dipeptidase [Gemmatimonadota bacterium]
MSASSDRIARDLPRYREELFDFLRIPSVSARSEHDADTRRAARWLAERLEAAGLDAEVLDTPGHPVVLAEWRGAGEDAPTVLVYGHYDVQPAEPLDEWTSPPFDPAVREGRIWARGSADDKGQLFMHVKALEAALADGGVLPVNVVVLAEGEEEIGSPSLVPFVEEHADRLKADVVVISDSAMFEEGQPSLLFSLRGLAYLELRARAARSDLHSGAYGGAVPNPATALARILATFHDDDGRIAVPGFYDPVLEWDEATRETIRRLPFDDATFEKEVGVTALAGEKGYSTLERLWIRPTCEVNGLLSGYTGEGAKTVLPARAMAKVSFRLVPDQRPAQVARQVRDHVARVTPPGVEVEIVELHGGLPWKAEVGGPLFDAASVALEEAFGTKPLLTGEGGSIPIVVEFERILDAPVLLVGFASPGANMHAPDEWLSVGNFEKGIPALVRLYEEIGARLG